VLKTVNNSNVADPSHQSNRQPDRAASTSTPDRVAAAITRGVLMRRFTAGQRLIEAELTRSLQVSRGTIREAVRILAASGVVELTP